MSELIACPSLEQISSLLLGVGSDAQLLQFGQHVESCPDCLERIGRLNSSDLLLESVRRQGEISDDPALLLQAEQIANDVTSQVAAAHQKTTLGGAARSDRDLRDLLAHVAPAIEPGDLGLLGEFRLQKVLGQGGMGIVFLAWDIKLARKVALKTILPSLASHPQAVERFMRESRAAAAVNSDHVVRVYQVGISRGIPFLAQEYLTGQTLDSLLLNEPIPAIAEALRMARQIAVGLAAAHDEGLLHRDIKPANIWIESPSGRVKILDFGLARFRSGSQELTRSGAMLGTPAYMAPEQAAGQEVDHRCDLFSLGCVLYRMTTGKRPFEGSDVYSVIHALAVQTPAPPETINPAIPAAVSALIQRLLAKDRDQRPASAHEVVQTLAELERSLSEGTSAGDPPQVATASPPDRRPPRRRAMLAAAAASLLMLCGVIVITLTRKDGTKTRIEVPDAADQPVIEVAVKVEPSTRPAAAAVAVPSEPRKWRPGDGDDVMPGLIQRPAALAGLKRWQVDTTGLRGHPDAVAWNPNGKEVAIVSEGRVRLIQVSPWKFLRMLDCDGVTVNSCDWNPTGSWLALGCADRSVRLIKDDGTAGPILKGHTGNVRLVKWNRAGTLLASYGAEDAIHVWNADGSPHSILSDAFAVKCLSWSYDDRLAWCGITPHICIERPGEGNRQTLASATNMTVSIDWSADGRLAAQSPAGVGCVRVWNADGTPLAPFDTGSGAGNNILWGAADELIMDCTINGLCCWNLETGRARWNLPLGWWVSRISLSPDKRRILCGLEEGDVVVCDTEGRLLNRQAAMPIQTSLQWNQTGTELASGGSDRLVRRWNRSGESQTARKTAGKVEAICWSPTGRRFAAAVERLVSTGAGVERSVFVWTEGDDLPLSRKVNDAIAGLAFSPDETSLVVGSGNPVIWNLVTGASTTLKVPGGAVCLNWSPHAQVMTGSRDHHFYFWNADGTQAGTVAKGEGVAESLSWSANGQLVAVASIDYRATWILDSKGERKQNITTEHFTLQHVSLRNDGEQLVTGGFGPAVRLWNLAGERLGELDTHRLCVSLHWAPVDEGPIAISFGSRTEVWDSKLRRLLWSTVALPAQKTATFTAAGELVTGSPADYDDELVYVVQRSDGYFQQLKPSEFEERYIKQP